LKLVRRNKTDPQTQGGKKSNRAKDRKKTIIFLNCNIQYPRPKERKGCGRETRRIKKKKKKRKYLMATAKECFL
jgi:hypothetical protein